MNRPPQAPDCYGTHLWSATAPDCIGGPDAGYTHPQTGSHNRERCRFYQACAQDSARNKTQQAIVPVQSLYRQPPSPTIMTGVQPPPRPVAPTMSYPPRIPLHVQQPYIPPVQPQVQPHHPMGFAPPHVAQEGPTFVPVPYQMPGAQIPAYLTMPEPVGPGESAAGALGRTLLRSVFKAIGHSAASFFDHVPLKPHRSRE